ncbi:MAG: hypothetical protein ACJ8F7_13275 [Gemmataceae bacterium]
MNELTTEQTSQLGKALFPHVNYLYRLKRRMEQLRFPPNDPLYVRVVAAYDAAWRLSREVHYLSCSTGVGRPPRQ